MKLVVNPLKDILVLRGVSAADAQALCQFLATRASTTFRATFEQLAAEERAERERKELLEHMEEFKKAIAEIRRGCDTDTLLMCRQAYRVHRLMLRSVVGAVKGFRQVFLQKICNFSQNLKAQFGNGPECDDLTGDRVWLQPYPMHERGVQQIARYKENRQGVKTEEAIAALEADPGKVELAIAGGVSEKVEQTQVVQLRFCLMVRAEEAEDKLSDSQTDSGCLLSQHNSASDRS